MMKIKKAAVIFVVLNLFINLFGCSGKNQPEADKCAWQKPIVQQEQVDAAHGEWQELDMGQNHSYANYCFNISIYSDEGKLRARGTFYDVDSYELYSIDYSDPGIVLSEEAVSALREMKLEQFQNKQDPEPQDPDEEIFALDETTKYLTLYYADGTKETKELPGNVISSILELMSTEFRSNAS